MTLQELLSGFFTCGQSFMGDYLVKRRPKVKLELNHPEVVYVRDLPKADRQG